MDAKFPLEKVNGDDEGATEMLIGEENGVLILKFKKPIIWVGFPPEQAIQLANLIIGRAKEMIQERKEKYH